MIPAVEFLIFTDNSTLRGNVSILIPSKQDSRVLDREYRLYASSQIDPVDERGGRIGGSIKCHNESDVQIVCNNLISLVQQNDLKVLEGSFIGIHYCHQVEDDLPVKPCTLTKLWSK
jgi:hypothetical protein